MLSKYWKTRVRVGQKTNKKQKNYFKDYLNYLMINPAQTKIVVFKNYFSMKCSKPSRRYKRVRVVLPFLFLVVLALKKINRVWKQPLEEFYKKQCS